MGIKYGLESLDFEYVIKGIKIDDGFEPSPIITSIDCILVFLGKLIDTIVLCEHSAIKQSMKAVKNVCNLFHKLSKISYMQDEKEKIYVNRVINVK